MAEIAHSGLVNTREGRISVTWANVTESGTFEAVDLSGVFGAPFIVSIQIADTVGGATTAIHGSLDGTNYAALGDITGTAIAMTAANDIAEIGETAIYYKPVASGGSSQSIDCTMIFWMV